MGIPSGCDAHLAWNWQPINLLMAPINRPDRASLNHALLLPRWTMFIHPKSVSSVKEDFAFPIKEGYSSVKALWSDTPVKFPIKL